MPHVTIPKCSPAPFWLPCWLLSWMCCLVRLAGSPVAMPTLPARDQRRGSNPRSIWLPSGVLPKIETEKVIYEDQAIPRWRRPGARGSADFTESKILAEIYSQALKAKGVESSTKLGIGSREIYIKALQDQSISAVPEYTGNLLLYFDADATATTADEVEKSLPAVLPPGLKVLKSSAAVDQDVYVVTKELSAQHGITSLEDLKKIASTATLGGPPELEKQTYGPPGLEKIYGAKFKAFVPYPKYPPKISDLHNNKIQVATFFTT